jgi:RNA polymerase sigma-70 factor (ECF subfamily)
MRNASCTTIGGPGWALAGDGGRLRSATPARVAASLSLETVDLSGTPPSLLARVANGDGSAVAECVDTYGRLIWSLALRLSPSRADAEDAVQDIFLDLWRRAAAYDPARGEERVYVAMLARRRLIDRWRAAERRPSGEELPADDAPGALAAAGRPEDDVAVAQVLAALQSLDADQRDVIELGVVQGLSHSEIAERLGRPLGTVKTHMRRGLIRLRHLLGESGEEGT